MVRTYEDGETRRHQVAQAALRTIVEDGIAHFTTRAIASRVGISDGSIFRHFENKEEIVLAAMELLSLELQNGLDETDDALKDLEQFFRHRAAFVGAEGAVGRLIFSDEFVRLAGDKGQNTIAGWRMKSVGYLLNCFCRLQSEGRIRSDLPPQSLIMLTQGLLLTFAMQASFATPNPIEQLNEQIDLAWNTLNTILNS